VKIFVVVVALPLPLHVQAIYKEKKWTELENNKVNFKNKVVQKKKLHGLEEHVLIPACAHQERSRKVANFISC